MSKQGMASKMNRSCRACRATGTSQLTKASVVVDPVNVLGQSNLTPFKARKRDLSTDFERLLKRPRQNFSDVTLCVGGREVQAHKAILSARSPVFSAMFAHEMEESKQGRVDIIDMEYEVLQEMLMFIYTGKVPHLKEMANRLLAAADKYALEMLKIMCEEALCSNLNTDNVADILILADLHSSDQLKGQCMNFITSHATDVIETHGWKQMIESHSYLSMGLFRALAFRLALMEDQLALVDPTRKRLKY